MSSSKIEGTDFLTDFTNDIPAEKALSDILLIWSNEYHVEHIELVWDSYNQQKNLTINNISRDFTFPKKNDKKNPNFDRYFELVSPLAFMPSRATSGSAGYDFRSPVNIVIHPNETIVINTGVRVFMETNEVLLLYPRSSVAINKDLILKNSVAVIDSDFHDEIQIPITNVGKSIRYINRKDKIAQGIFQKFFTVNDMPQQKRSGGIGSSGS